MRLMSAVLAFVLKKFFLLAALVSFLFVLWLLKIFLLPAVGDAADRTAELRRVTSQVEEERRQVSMRKSDFDDLVEKKEDICGFTGRVGDALNPRGAPCKSAQKKVDEAEEGLKAAKKRLAKLEDRKDDLVEQRKSPQDRVLNQWSKTWRWLLAVAVLVLVLPVVLRIVSYFLLMPMVSRSRKPIHLAAGSEHATAELRNSAAERTLTIELGAGDVLSARSEYVRPVQGTVRSQLLYQWTSPFISFAAGLYGLSRVIGDEGGSSATLGKPDDPDSYLMRIDFKDHPGLVMQPKHVVGVIGAPELETRWRWGIQSFARWQVRYIMFAGTGSLIVQGSGDVVETNPKGGSTRMDQNLVMGFDSRLTVGVDLTDVFVPYLWGRRPLVDDKFTGHHPLFWQKSSADGPSNPIAKTFGAFFSALGKLFGF